MTIGKLVGISALIAGLSACGGKVASGGDGAGDNGTGGNGANGNGTGGNPAGGNGGTGPSAGPTTSGSGGSPAITTGSTPPGMGGAPNPGTSVANITTTGGVIPPINSTTTGMSMPPATTTGSVTPPIPPTDCTPLYQSVEQGWCELQLECNGRWAFAYCEGWDEDTAYCNCDTERSYGSYQLQGVSFSDACPLTAGLCLGAIELEYSDPMCQVRWGESGPDYCSTETECVRTASVTPDITATTTEWRSSWCQSSGAGTSTCECRRGERYLRFDLPASVTPEICAAAHDLCSTGDVSTSGEKTCSINFQSASPDWCEAALDCAQEATIGDTPVTLHSDAWTNCERNGPSDWRCGCNGETTSEAFNLDNEDPWLACQEAAKICGALQSP